MRVGGRHVGGERPTGRPTPPVEAFFFFFSLCSRFDGPTALCCVSLSFLFFFTGVGSGMWGWGACRPALAKSPCCMSWLSCRPWRTVYVDEFFWGGGAHGHDGVGAATNHSGAEPACGKNQIGKGDGWRVEQGTSETGDECDMRGARQRRSKTREERQPIQKAPIRNRWVR